MQSAAPRRAPAWQLAPAVGARNPIGRHVGVLGAGLPSWPRLGSEVALPPPDFNTMMSIRFHMARKAEEF